MAISSTISVARGAQPAQLRRRDSNAHRRRLHECVVNGQIVIDAVASNASSWSEERGFTSAEHDHRSVCFHPSKHVKSIERGGVTQHEPRRTNEQMLNRTVSALRVSRTGLIVAAGVVVLPALTIMDRSAAAREVPVPVAEAVAIASVTAEAAENTVETKVTTTFDAVGWEMDVLDGLDRGVFERALTAAEAAVERGDADAPDTLTVIDFSKPSTEQRMWVFDLDSRELLFKELVSHGRGSGLTNAKSFSNTDESHKSSLGLFRTAETYVGKHGYSLRLDGLEAGVNDRARARAIVIHPAPYVSPSFAKAQGYLGRSHGCPALRPEISRRLIDAVKGGGLLFAYYPDQQWLETSAYLN